MVIQNNQFSVYTQQSGISTKQSEKVAENGNAGSETGKQSSDFRSRFEEKAASLTISGKTSAQISEIRQAVGDLKGGSAKTQITNTALSQVQGLVHRTNALTIQALNDTNTSWNQQMIDTKIKNLKEEIDRISRIPGKEDVQAAEERIENQPVQALAAQANQTTERVLGLLA